MKIIIKMLLYSFFASIFITQITENIVMQQYLFYFSLLGAFIIAGNELIKLEQLKGE